MCGIAGFADSTGRVAPEVLDVASRAIAHRGPDDEGRQIVRMNNGRGHVGLANRRLSILDLSPAGHQPMCDPASGNWIAYNGEVFNFRDVREQLQRQGVVFQSQSDTEVILKAYGMWREQCLDRFRGMFAIAIWDVQRQRLFLARDRLGKKPLYYWYDGTKLLFASEVRALLATDLIPRRINHVAVEHFLTFGSVGEEETLIESIQALPPASYLTWQDGQIEGHEYWDPVAISLGNRPRSEDSALSRLRTLLSESVHLRMVSDVPVGIFLSGGIDSSALVAILSRGGQKINTFSIVFKDTDYNEGQFSRAVARRFQSEHHEIELMPGDFLDSVPEALAALDQPSVDGSNSFVISREVRRTGLKVALSGLGGDEIFGGYDTFRSVPQMERFLSFRRWLPAPVRTTVSRAFRDRGNDRARKLATLIAGNGSDLHPYFLARALFTANVQRELRCSREPSPQLKAAMSRLLARCAGLDAVGRVSYLELRSYMATMLLRDTDCMSMAHGLEVRTPFLDHILVEYALSIPGEIKLSKQTPKHLLVKAMDGMLPDEIVYRPKRGFTLPFEHWLRNELKSSVEKVLIAAGHGPLDGVLNAAAVREVWQSFLEGKTSWSRPWSLYVLDRWCAANL